MKFTPRKKVFVTGATGFVGANLVRRLINQNHEVHIIKRKNSNIWRIKDIASKLHVHEIDLSKKKHLTTVLYRVKPSIIFHLANLGSYAGVDPSIEKSIKTNLLGTTNLIESAHVINYECFINTGSSSEYGKKNSPMREIDSCQPATNYAIAKLAGTLYGQAYAKRTGKPLATLRLFSPFGAFDHPARLISSTILKILKGEKLLFNNLSDVRDYIFIDDVVEAYLFCMKKSSLLSGEIFNIGSGKQTLVRDIVQLLVRKMKSGNQAGLNEIVSKKDNLVWQADIQKAKKILGWQPKMTLDQGLSKTIAWFKNYAYLYE